MLIIVHKSTSKNTLIDNKVFHLISNTEVYMLKLNACNMNISLEKKTELATVKQS